jgi:phosphoribosyl 1,2-cyclic phosphodiesterase
MGFSFTILGSGSGGNCAFLESPSVKILIDAGFSGRQITERLASIGCNVAELDAILLTHEHADHIAGLNVLCQKHRVPLFCNRLTREMLAAQLPNYQGWKVFSTGEAFELGDLLVESFPLPHDASDPVGFLIHAGPQKVAFVTDLGYIPKLIVERIKEADIMILETNHDLELLRNDTRRPWSVKQRILSRHGHLSNDTAAAALPQIVSEKLKNLFLAHLSRDCNDPALALRAITEKLDHLGARHVDVSVAEQSRPASTLCW